MNQINIDNHHGPGDSKSQISASYTNIDPDVTAGKRILVDVTPRGDIEDRPPAHP
jgi:hypothetical protein